ncbi:MAG: hopanoid-associated sugar epimerase [Gammaproteobacteria bacterium]
MTTLVTGGTGFIGSAVVRRLLAAGHDVRALTRPESNRANLHDLPIQIVTGNLCDRASMDEALKGCDVLFHIAADYRLWTRTPQTLYQTNVTGTENIMRAALVAGVRRIVYTSSVATLGWAPPGRLADETTQVNEADMIGDYKRSKYLAEQTVSRLVAEDALPAVIVNPSTPVGPRDIKPTPTGRIIVEALRGRMPAYVDTGLNIVHVDDVAEGHLLALEHGTIGERYVLGGENLTLHAILSELAVLSGRKPPRIQLPHSFVLPIAYLAEGFAKLFRSFEPLTTVNGVRMSKKRMFYSSDKAKAELRYQPQGALRALADAVQWFRENGYYR